MTARLLIVEDDDVYAYLLDKALRREGCEVERVSSSFAALAVLDRSDGFDLFIIDIRLRLGDPHGPVLGRLVQERRPGTPLLYVSAGAPDEWMAEAAGGPLLSKAAGLEAIVATALSLAGPRQC